MAWHDWVYPLILMGFRCFAAPRWATRLVRWWNAPFYGIEGILEDDSPESTSRCGVDDLK